MLTHVQKGGQSLLSLRRVEEMTDWSPIDHLPVSVRSVSTASLDLALFEFPEKENTCGGYVHRTPNSGSVCRSNFNNLRWPFFDASLDRTKQRIWDRFQQRRPAADRQRQTGLPKVQYSLCTLKIILSKHGQDRRFFLGKMAATNT